MINHVLFTDVLVSSTESDGIAGMKINITKTEALYLLSNPGLYITSKWSISEIGKKVKVSWELYSQVI